MRSQLRRFALALGVTLAAAGLHSAPAQTWYSQPIGPPAFGPNSINGPIRSTSPAAAASTAVPGFPGAVNVSGGCGTCGTPGQLAPAIGDFNLGARTPSSSHPLAARFAASPLGIGEGCASGPGCSSFAQTRTFQLGSCRQFFNPGNKCGCFGQGCSGGASGGCGGGSSGLFGRGHVPMVYGPGGLGNPNPCAYGSYNSR